MLEYIYKIDLPPFNNLIKQPRPGDSDLVTFPMDQESPKHVRRKPVITYFHRHYYKINDFYLEYVYINYKSNCSSEIIVSNPQYIKKDTDPCYWAICWPYTGSTTIDYWNVEDITTQTPKQEPITETWSVECTTESPPAKTYNLINNQAYLMKLSQPWRFTGTENTYLVDVRPRSYIYTWNEVVEKFQNYIISD